MSPYGQWGSQKVKLAPPDNTALNLKDSKFNCIVTIYIFFDSQFKSELRFNKCEIKPNNKSRKY